jgi:hypothetical protein
MPDNRRHAPHKKLALRTNAAGEFFAFGPFSLVC